ncbi:MAG: NAD(P)H-hydrate epimerase, partial [Thermoplasmata archaeon]|nr:NAD(P)H-hydrate epimerase [Thermoplasmata archaeon]
MIPLREVAVLDGNSAALGVPQSRLMENAGAAVADRVICRFAPGRVLVACGGGNNGGDGYVAARRLAETGIEVLIVAAADPSTDLALDAAVRLPSSVRKVALDDLAPALERVDLVIDALLGVGARGRPREPYGFIIGSINQVGVPVVSVDVPSGFGSEMAVRPALTLTFHDLKEGMEGLDAVEVVDIGIPPEAAAFTGPGELTLVPGRARDAHKGDGGRVLIVGGGPYTGAAPRAALAARWAGCVKATHAPPRSA